MPDQHGDDHVSRKPHITQAINEENKSEMDSIFKKTTTFFTCRVNGLFTCRVNAINGKQQTMF